DLNSMTWSSLQTAQRPAARSDMVYGMDIYAGYRNVFVITGGKGDGDIVYNDTWAFDITYNTWSEITNVSSTSGPIPQIYGAVGGIDTSVQGGSQTTPNTTIWLTHGTNGKDLFTDLWAVVLGGTLATSGNNLNVRWTKISTNGQLPP
ncbi:26479_t:CDS:1, partial [Racocetra persica]